MGPVVTEVSFGGCKASEGMCHKIGWDGLRRCRIR